MSRVIGRQKYVQNTDLGNVIVVQEEVRDFDVEDIVRDRAFSQAMAVKFLNLGRRIDPNNPSAARTISSAYLNNSERLT